MTVPTLAQPIAIGQAANTPANLADRTQLLADTHPWMSPDTNQALAQSDTSTSELSSIADGIKSSLAQTWNGFTEHFDDAILHKQPSGALALARFLHASLGPLPVAQQDLHVIQANLAKQGFGKDLPINGVWDSGWNSAYNDWANNLRTRQIAGDKPGAVSTAHAGHSIFSSLLPSHVINAVTGFAHGLAHGVNTLIGDVAGDIVDIPHLLTGHTDQSNAAESTRAFFQNLGGGNLTAQDIARQNEIQRVTQDVGTILALVPVAGEGTAAARVARGAWEGGVNREFAQRGPGVIAKSFFGGRTGTQIAAGETPRGLLNTRVFSNIPILRQAGPAVGRLADENGLYYKTRTMLAAPYALPQVRVAGALGQRYMIAGAGVNLAADTLPHVGIDNQLLADVRNSNTVDTIDLNLGRIIGSPNSHLFSRAVDSLGFVLHGPLGATHYSTAVGDVTQRMTDNLSDLLGHYNAEGAWERAVSKATGKKTSIEDIRTTFGDDQFFDRFMAAKLADLAESHYAQAQAQREGLTFGSDTYRERLGQLADEVWNNPDLHAEAVKELLADPIELENRIAADMVHNRLNPREYNPTTLDDPTQPADLANYASNGKAWMEAGSKLSDLIRSGGARYLFGSDGKTIIANAQDNFDHGFNLDAAPTTRVSTQTRREYVNQVSTLLTQVRRQVDKVRTQIGKDVATAEQTGTTPKAQAALRAARLAQQQLEADLDRGNLRPIADLMAKTTTVRRTQREWDRLVKDAARLRALVDQGTDGRLTLRSILEDGVNPDDLYTNINGEPRLPDEPIGTGDWMRRHLQHSTGAVTVARNDYKTAQEAAADIGRFQARLDAAGKDTAKLTRILEDAKNYGFREFGMDERNLGVFDGDPTKLLQVLSERATKQASMVYRTFDTPPEVAGTLQQIEDGGYKVVLGSHVGHLWDSSLPPMPDLHGAVGLRRKVAGVLGVTPEQVSSRAAGQDASIRVLREVAKAVAGRPMPPRTTAETVLAVLRDDNLIHPQLGLPEHVATTLTRRFHAPGIRQLAKTRGLDYDAARSEYEAAMARYLQLRDVPRSKFIKALTTPRPFGNGAQWYGVDKQTANLIRRAVLKGYADRPGHIQGLSSLEDWARGGFSLGGKVSPAVRLSQDNALGEVAQRAAELPNSLVNLRNRLRFTLSPFFDFRRVAKQNVKMSIDGVTPVMNPLAHLVNNDTFTQAHKLLDRLIGDPQYMGFDDADRYLHQQSVWGLYNSRHFEAYYAWEKKAQGATDEEIRQGIRRVFEYGSQRASGRSALERTVNTIFFPFSFEKTLLRNVGAYMIDHPQQALLLTAAITAYDDANTHNQIHNWVADHLPVLRDLQKLNAFAHGLSLGEVGGINAPLMNLFLPQKWDGGLTKKNLQRFLPVWNDFGQVLHDAREQGVIAYSAAANSADYAISLGAKRPMLDPYRSTITPEAQQRHATALRNQMILAWTGALDYNAHQSSDATKYTFPNDPSLPTSVRGKVVNRTNIGYLVKVWYPAYDPGEARRFAEQQAEKAQHYVDSISDPAKRRDYGVFLKLSNQVQGHLQRGDYDTATATQVMTQFRAAAIAAAESDPTFYKAYNTYFRWLYGPLEQITGTPT